VRGFSHNATVTKVARCQAASNPDSNGLAYSNPKNLFYQECHSLSGVMWVPERPSEAVTGAPGGSEGDSISESGGRHHAYWPEVRRLGQDTRRWNREYISYELEKQCITIQSCSKVCEWMGLIEVRNAPLPRS
jgi:hypothetical protein